MDLWIVVMILCTVGCIPGGNSRTPGDGSDVDGYHPGYWSPDANTRMKRDISHVKQTDWMKMGHDEIKEAVRVNQNLINKRAKNVILFISDGMGISTTTAARLYNYQQNHDTVSEAKLSYEKFPHVGLSMFYSTNSMSPDSACTGTAIQTGEKTGMGMIGVSQDLERYNCTDLLAHPEKNLRSFLIRAQDQGKATGVVTTTRVTHATPAAAYAHSADRYWENDSELGPQGADCMDIAKQLVMTEEGAKLKLIMGGGRAQMTPTDVADPEYPEKMGKREDNENLIERWLELRAEEGMSEDSYKYVWNKEQLDALNLDEVDKLMALFEPSHMQYEVDKEGDDRTEPNFPEVVEAAIAFMSKYEEGYTLMIESGRIDHAHHDTLANKAIRETMKLHEGIQKAVEMTSEDDTLIVLTSDHSSPLTVSGYASLDSNIMGIGDNVDLRGEDRALDGKRVLNMNYVHGPAFFDYRYDLADGEEPPILVDQWDQSKETVRTNPADEAEHFEENTFRHDAPIPLKFEAHAGEEVAIYARGPMAHMIHGVHEQSYIGHMLMYAQCSAPYEDDCPPINEEMPVSGADSNHINICLATILTICLLLLNNQH